MPERVIVSSLPEHRQEANALGCDALASPFRQGHDARFLYVNAMYNQIYATLLTVIRERKGLAVLTGEAGTGKTTLLHLLTASLDETSTVAFIQDPPRTFADLVFMLCDQLSVRSGEDLTTARLALLEEHLRARAFRGETTTVVVDDAHTLDLSLFDHLQALLNLQGQNGNLLSLILAGHPQLERLLALPVAQPLAQRIAVRCQLTPLPAEEVEAFIQHRLRTATWPQTDLFSPAAIASIASHSRGLPQRINIMCESALRAAYAAGEKTISEALIEGIVATVHFPEPDPLTTVGAVQWAPNAPDQRPTVPPLRQSWRDRQDVRTRLLGVSRMMFVVSLGAFFLLAGVSVWKRIPSFSTDGLVRHVQMAVATLVGGNVWSVPPARNVGPAGPLQRSASTMALQTQPLPEEPSSVLQPQAPHPSGSHARRKGKAAHSSVRARTHSPIPSPPSRALLRSVEHGNVSTANRLLSAGAAANARTKEGWTALILAAQRNLFDLANTLLTRGADVNARDTQGRTALMHAAREGHRQTVELLVNQGADVSATDRAGWTALMYAQSPPPTPEVSPEKSEDYQAIATLLQQAADTSDPEPEKAAP